MVYDEFKYRVFMGLMQLAGDGLSNYLLKPNYEEQHKIKEQYYAEAKKIIKQKEKEKATQPREETPQRLQLAPPLEGDLATEKVSIRETKTTACLSCSRSHVAAAAGLLAEGKRFLNDEGGITSSEVISRIDLATQEITAMERGDLHPDKISSLPADEKMIAEWTANKIRDIRHTIDHISTKEEYMKAIEELADFSRELNKRYYTMLSDGNNITKICKGLKEEDYQRCIKTINTILNEKKSVPP